nr:hypothetical protein [Mycoplasmopsis bovis]
MHWEIYYKMHNLELIYQKCGLTEYSTSRFDYTFWKRSIIDELTKRVEMSKD